MVQIKVLSVETPSLFYFRYFNSPQEYKKVKAMERDMKNFIETRGHRQPFMPAPNSTVAYLTGQVWKRAKIVSKSDNGMYELFMVDYGHYETTNRVGKFAEIADTFKIESGLVQRGTLGLQPGEMIRDRSTSMDIVAPVAYWSTKSIHLMQNWISHNDFLYYFEPRGKQYDGTHIGDIFVQDRNQTFSISEILRSQNLAVLVEVNPQSSMVRQNPSTNYSKPTTSMGTAPQRANALPSRLSEVQQVGRITNNKRDPIPKSQIKPIQEQKVPNEPAILKNSPGAKLPAQRQNSKNVKSKTSALAKQQPRGVPSTKPPTDIMVFGMHLLPPVQSIDASPFSKAIKTNLVTHSADAFSKLQSHSWAHLNQGRSMVIIGKGSIKSRMDSTLPAILNTLQKNRESTLKDQTAMGPIAIVITKSSQDVKDIAEMSIRIAPEVDIVQAAGMDNKVFDLINGCELLVTTPPAIVRLIESVALKIIDNERIKHVIFDGVDAMMEPFDSEIHKIIRTCTYGRMRASSNPQIIITSGAWSKDIKIKFMPLMELQTRVICIEDFIEAAAFCGCEFGMETCTSVDEKIVKLLRSFDDGSYKNKRTVVVTNDRKSLDSLASCMKVSHVDCSSVATEWEKQKQGSFSVLILLDENLKSANLTSAQRLIHFAVPLTWSLFTRRFSLLADQMYLHNEKRSDDTAPFTKIFLDDENVVEFAKLVEFLQSRQLAKIPESIVGSVKRIRMLQESSKCDRSIAICADIWRFGECKKQSCSARHILMDSEKLRPSMPIDSLIKFKLEKTNSPTNYVIKILAHVSNNKWITWDNKINDIEKILAEELPKFCIASDLQKVIDAKVGEIYAAPINNIWRRCKLIEKSSNLIAKVYLVDIGNTDHCVLSKLLDLPAKFKNMQPLVYNLRILNVIPLDFEDCFNSELEKKLREKIQKADDCTFICKFQFAIRENLFTESFEARDVELGVVKLRLKQEMLNMKMCTVDGSVGEKLRKLANIDLNNVPQNDITDGEEALEAFETTAETIEAEFKEPEVVQINWKELSWKSSYEGRVKFFKNPESFLFVEAAEKKTTQKFMHQLESYEAELALDFFEVGQVCGVKKEKLRRGQIVKVNEDDSIEVLLVDCGEIVTSQKSDLFKLPNELVTKLPFQAVHCRMVGVRPLFNIQPWVKNLPFQATHFQKTGVRPLFNMQWPPEQSEAIHNLIRGVDGALKIYVMQKSEKFDSMPDLGMNYYDVILIDEKNGLLDEIAVAKRFADRVDYKKPILEDSTDEPVNEEKDLELLKKLLEQEYNRLEPSEDEEESEQVERKQQVTDESTAIPPGIDALKVVSPLSHLKYIYNQPKIEWRQNEVMIYLLIAAHDCEEYGLRVNDSSVEIAIKYNGNRYEGTVIELYGGIDAKMTSHELRGLNIIVRLKKRMTGYDWPRLTESNERSQFIKFSSEKISTKYEQERVRDLPVQRFAGASKYARGVPSGFEDSLDFEEASDIEDSVLES